MSSAAALRGKDECKRVTRPKIDLQIICLVLTWISRLEKESESESKSESESEKVSGERW